IVQRAQQLHLGMFVTARPVAADADAEEAGTAALALSLPNGVQDAGPHAVQVAVGPLAVERRRQRILGAHVLAAAALENEANVHRLLTVLVPVEDRTAGTEIVAGVAAADAVDGILPQVALRRRLGHRVFADIL